MFHKHPMSFYNASYQGHELGFAIIKSCRGK